MTLLNAINLLVPFHNAIVTCIVRKDNGKFDAQLSTGLNSVPFIPINDSEVATSDVLEVLDIYENNTDEVTNPFEIPSSENPLFFDYSTTLDSEIWGCA